MNDDQRDPTGYVVVFAVHPVIGRMFWVYVDESSVNAPDYFGLTLHQNYASWIPAGWRKDRSLPGGCADRDLTAWQADGFLNALLDEHRLESEYKVRFNGDHPIETHLSGSLEQLRLQSAQTAEDFIRWISSVEWTDKPAVNLID